MFDGKSFQNFTTTNGLPGNDVLAFHSDLDGKVWIGTDHGVSCYDGERFVATYRRHQDQMPHNFVQAIHRDRRNLPWFGTPAGATRFDGRVWSTLTTRDGLIGNNVQTICEDKEGAIWFGTDRGITRYQPKQAFASTPVVAVETDRLFENISELPPILLGQRVTIHLAVTDDKTRPETRRFRYQVVEGRSSTA